MTNEEMKKVESELSEGREELFDVAVMEGAHENIFTRHDYKNIKASLNTIDVDNTDTSLVIELIRFAVYASRELEAIKKLAIPNLFNNVQEINDQLGITQGEPVNTNDISV